MTAAFSHWKALGYFTQLYSLPARFQCPKRIWNVHHVELSKQHEWNHSWVYLYNCHTVILSSDTRTLFGVLIYPNISPSWAVWGCFDPSHGWFISYIYHGFIVDISRIQIYNIYIYTNITYIYTYIYIYRSIILDIYIYIHRYIYIYQAQILTSIRYQLTPGHNYTRTNLQGARQEGALAPFWAPWRAVVLAYPLWKWLPSGNCVT